MALFYGSFDNARDMSVPLGRSMSPLFDSVITSTTHKHLEASMKEHFGKLFDQLKILYQLKSDVVTLPLTHVMVTS